ncbi:MAG: hypothetical protein FWD75_08835 [Propionibacteriaceae bacterium]|nr:hypothetical protein [Propionibacteriaceae bacterium]
MKAELRSLSADTARVVGAHLMMAGMMMDQDPQLAHRHAEAARRRAARLPITREVAAETAYAAGLYDEALSQYRTLRRMTGSADLIPVMVDCLRAQSKYREALELSAEGEKEIEDPSMRLELLIVTAGVRVDMGQREEAMRLLRREIERPTIRHPRVAQARLLYAYSDLLAQAGDMANAYRGFAMAARIDPEGETAALDRLDEFDGITLDVDESEFMDEEIDDQDDLDESEDDLEDDEDDQDEFEDDLEDDQDEFEDDLDELEDDSDDDLDEREDDVAEDAESEDREMLDDESEMLDDEEDIDIDESDDAAESVEDESAEDESAEDQSAEGDSDEAESVEAESVEADSDEDESVEVDPDADDSDADDSDLAETTDAETTEDLHPTQDIEAQTDED